MGLVEHLVEFRNRLVISVIAIVIGAVIGFLLTDAVFNAIRVPVEELNASRDAGASINWGNVTSAFDMRLQMALTLGVVISSPVWLYEIWMFLMPGLKRKERRYALGFLGAAIPLFFAGVWVGWLLLPRIVEVMASFAPSEDTLWFTGRDYVGLVLQLCLAVGIAFVVPVLLVMLNFAGVLQGITILKGWRVAVLLVSVFAAMATPSADVLSMFLLMLPMIGLYFLAVGVAVLNDRRRARRQAEFEAELDAELT